MAISSEKGRIFAAVGAATGLGNVFRFPAMCAKYGAAFIIAYAAALMFICFPLLCAELSIGKYGAVKRAKIWRFISVAAAVNSLFIATYYGSICYKLGNCALSFAFCGDVVGGGTLSYVLAVAPFAAVFFILAGGGRAISASGKVSVVSSFALFTVLAVAGIAKGGAFASFDVSALAAWKIWPDALGQALLSLSLAAGVMPAFAETLPENFSPQRSAAAVILSNFAGCMVVSLATLPYTGGFSGSGLSAALTVFPRLVYSVAPDAAPLAGFTVFAVLTAVGVHSMCALATPAVAPLIKKYGVRAPFLFCVVSMALAPAMLSDGRALLNFADRLACSFFAVGIAAAECVYFTSIRFAPRRRPLNTLFTKR